MSPQLDIMEADISEVIGLSTLPEEDKVVMLRDLGDLVIESALIRLTADLSDEQVVALDQYTDTVSDSQILLKHLFEQYPNFENILVEEVKAFKEEAVAVFSKNNN